MTSSPSWSLQGGMATISGAASGELDLAAAANGIAHFACGTRSAGNSSLLGVLVPRRDGPEQLADSFVRGDKLVARFAPRQPDLLYHELDYTLRRRDGLCSVELVLATRTETLDSEPLLTVRTTFRDTELSAVFSDGTVQRLDGCAAFCRPGAPAARFFLASPHEGETCIVLGVHPDDFHEVEVNSGVGGANSQVDYRVFPGSLEKGVIRKARFFVCLVPREADLSAAKAVFDAFSRAELPLAV